jgi:hypothetical protein
MQHLEGSGTPVLYIFFSTNRSAEYFNPYPANVENMVSY